MQQDCGRFSSTMTQTQVKSVFSLEIQKLNTAIYLNLYSWPFRSFVHQSFAIDLDLGQIQAKNKILVTDLTSTWAHPKYI